MRLFLSILVVVSFLLTSASSAVTVGFESAEGYTLGALCAAGGGQQGWSGGVQAGCTNNDPGDEQVVDTESFAGSNSWHYARGYGSSGQGTPFSPTLPSVAGPGTIFEFSIYFKAADASGDGSSQNIYIGSEAGNDRTGFNINLHNDAAGNGLNLTTFEYGGGAFPEHTLVVDLDRNAWHQVSVVASFAADPANDVYEYSVNGNPAGARGLAEGVRLTLTRLTNLPWPGRSRPGR